MYNEEIKQQFFKEKKWATATIKGNLFYFDVLGQTESYYSKDLGEMTLEELKNAIKSLHRTTALDLLETTYMIKQYLEWYDSIAKDQLSHQRKIFIDSFDPLECAEELIEFPECLTFSQIVTMVDEVYSRTDGFLIWPIIVLSWIGLSVSEIVNLKENDFKWHSKQIKVGDQIFQFDREAYDILKIYLSTETGWRKQNRVFQVRLIDVGYYLKPTLTKNSKKTPSQITSKNIAAAFTAFNDLYQKKHPCALNLTHQYVWRMGAFSRLQQLDIQTDGGILNATPKAISAAYRTTANNRTKKLILAEYKIYKKKVAEVVESK